MLLHAERGLSGCKSMPIGKMKTAIIKNVDYYAVDDAGNAIKKSVDGGNNN